jgi:hypothetical protein
MTAIQAKFEEAVAAQADEAAEETVARYERGIRAIAASTLTGADYGDWVQQVCDDLLSGLEAECPNCGTFVHEGACVSEEGGA